MQPAVSRALFALLALPFAAMACSDAEAPTDAGHLQDAAEPSADAAIAQDAGILDASTPDALASPDASVPTVYYVEALNDDADGTGTEADPFRDLQFAINNAPSGVTLQIKNGNYSATAVDDTEALCGNCPVHETTVAFKRGFYVRGKSIVLQGESRTGTVLETNAGYGVFVLDSPRVEFRDLTITGGLRDPAEDATSAALVVRTSTVHVQGVRIGLNSDLRPNNEYPGIAGVAVREGGAVTVLNSVIEDNSWDGFVLYRGARGTIVNSDVRRGNGVGIAATWDAQLVAVNNRVTEYWKGIGGFGESSVLATNNLVFVQLGWGVWASGDASSSFSLINNTIADQGNCGMAINANARGRAANNIIVRSGTGTPWVCPSVGVWMFTTNTANLPFQYNLVWSHPLGNLWLGGTQPDGATGSDVDSVFIGMDGNVSSDPMFSGATYSLDVGSPARDTGDPSILDIDNTRSDMGHTGGPNAGLDHLP